MKFKIGVEVSVFSCIVKIRKGVRCMHHKDFEDRKTFIMMVGLPGSGKDYYIRQFLDKMTDRDNWFALGTDDIFEEWAARDGITYNDAFQRYNYKDVDREFHARIRKAFAEGKNVIWNQTNMTSKARQKKLRQVPNDYYKVAVVVVVPDNVLAQQLARREEETNGAKAIPRDVIDRMARTYVAPTKDEGWDKIYVKR